MPGGGAFGTALSVPLSANGHEVTLIFRDKGKARVFGETRMVERLSGILIPEENEKSGGRIGFSADAEKTVKNADVVIIAVPTPFMLPAYRESVMPFKKEETPVISGAKGLARIEGKYLRPSEIISLTDPKVARRLIVLSGPNLAHEIARGLFFVSVAASEDTKLAEYVAHDLFGLNPFSRIYASDDVAGVELGGAFKNVIAIAAGVCDGRHYGENARAALVQRGQEEMIRLGIRLGGRDETLRGVVGSDLWMTCVSEASRNHEYGVAISHGEDPVEVLAKFAMNKKTVEGYTTTKVVWELVQRLGIKAPLTEAAYSVLFLGGSIDDAIKGLLARERVYENGQPLNGNK